MHAFINIFYWINLNVRCVLVLHNIFYSDGATSILLTVASVREALLCAFLYICNSLNFLYSSNRITGKIVLKDYAKIHYGKETLNFLKNICWSVHFAYLKLLIKNYISTRPKLLPQLSVVADIIYHHHNFFMFTLLPFGIYILLTCLLYLHTWYVFGECR